MSHTHTHTRELLKAYVDKARGAQEARSIMSDAEVMERFRVFVWEKICCFAEDAVTREAQLMSFLLCDFDYTAYSKYWKFRQDAMAVVDEYVRNLDLIIGSSECVEVKRCTCVVEHECNHESVASVKYIIRFKDGDPILGQ